MKKIIASIAFIAIVTNGLNAQNNKLNWIGVNASISSGELIRFGGVLDGGVSYTGKIGYLVGIPRYPENARTNPVVWS